MSPSLSASLVVSRSTSSICPVTFANAVGFRRCDVGVDDHHLRDGLAVIVRASMARTCMLPLKPPLPVTSAIFANSGSSSPKAESVIFDRRAVVIALDGPHISRGTSAADIGVVFTSLIGLLS